MGESKSMRGMEEGSDLVVRSNGVEELGVEVV